MEGRSAYQKMRSFPVSTILKTKRLFLRFPKLEDAAQIFFAVKSQQFPEQLPLKEMRSENEIKVFLWRLQEGWKTGQVFSWIVEDHGARNVLGQMTLSKLEGDNLWAMAYWIHPGHWLKGYATEGAERLLAFGFEEICAEKIWAGAGEWNVGSCRVLKKIGMKFIGNNPKGYSSKGKPIATQEYEMT
ncbi:MAG TPA: GNAT family N-acetyltransferase, partial [Anaerolineales bacterium]|nr:GNAT family N-acetyltransferase [Anaerolineales bacterium]